MNANGVRLRWLVALAGALVAVSGASAQLPLEPNRETGQSITAAYEGWSKNADGTFSLLIGYYNRNTRQVVDIPVGPDNRIEPSGPDRGQPTHFEPKRGWGVFTVTIPADFTDKKLTWTLTANGKTTSVPMGLHRDYQVNPLRDAAEKNTPPVVRFTTSDPGFQGPPHGIGASFTAAIGSPLTLTAWVTDDEVVDNSKRKPEVLVTVSWHEFRGPGPVVFSNTKPPVDKADGKTTTTATFSAAGEYLIRLQANDVSGDGGGGFQCCWTNVHVRVTVAK